MRPKDIGVIDHNIQCIHVQRLKNTLGIKKQVISEKDDNLFSGAQNRLIPGNECAHKFNERCITRINRFLNETSEMEKQVVALRERHSQMFKFKKITAQKSEAREKKEGRARARSRKRKRLVKSCKE